jgi:hypothetical protein
MMDKNKSIIVDSDISREEILTQNPESPAPQKVIDAIEIILVEYLSFDGLLHRGQIAINKSLVSDLQKFFAKALEIKFPIEKVIPISCDKYKWNDEISCNDNNSSGYNFRLVLGTTRMSKHSEGVAFDINPVQNIYVRYDADMKEIVRYPTFGVYNEKINGTLVSGDPLVTLMKSLGWEWGGDWTPETGRVDYQHFEKKVSHF